MPGSRQHNRILLINNQPGEMNIELYSVRGFTGSALHHKLEQSLAARQLPYTINQVNHVGQFVKAGLASVPAFKIGEKIIQHPHEGDVEETVRQVIDYLLSLKAYSILVPIDFSEESTHAVSYACMIARRFGYGLTLAHVHQTMYDPISAGALDVQFLLDINKRLLEMVDSLNADHNKKGVNVPVTAHLEVGVASSSLIELLGQDQFEMIVMATKATDNAVRRFFGTVSSDVSRHSHKPVMVIPPQTEVKFPDRILVGFTEELFDEGVLEFIISFGGKQNVVFDFIHVTDDDRQFEILKNKLDSRLTASHAMLSDFNIKALKENELKIHEVLFNYATETRADMLILVSHHRSFMDNLLHSSVTKKALHQPPIPLMIVHKEVDNSKS
jgi:nucleotide-binding universal stress UspA family protein